MEYASLREKIAAEKVERTRRYAEFETMWAEAWAAGVEAVEKMSPPTPMIVAQHANPLNDRSPVEKAWIVPDGVCGFAWIKVRPANSSFAIWLKKTKNAHKSYYGGVEFSIFDYNQSYEKKIVHAAAMAAVLRGYGINCYSDGRLD